MVLLFHLNVLIIHVLSSCILISYVYDSPESLLDNVEVIFNCFSFVKISPQIINIASFSSQTHRIKHLLNIGAFL